MKVFIIAAISADGFIGVDESHLATSWTTKADKVFFVQRTKLAGTVVMGRKTFETFGKSLPGRRLIVLTSKPEQIKVEGVEATDEPVVDLVARLKSEGVSELAVCGGASIYTQFVQAGVVDELYLTVMPKFFGSGVSIFNAPQDVTVELIGSNTLDDDNSVLLQYRII